MWQHCSCVGLAHADLPGQWFCEQCRAALADPFWRCTLMFDQPVRLQRQQPAKYTPAGAAEYVWAGEVFVQARSSDLDLVRRQQDRIMVSASCLGRPLGTPPDGRGCITSCWLDKSTAVRSADTPVPSLSLGNWAVVRVPGRACLA